MYIVYFISFENRDNTAYNSLGISRIYFNESSRDDTQDKKKENLIRAHKLCDN